MRQRVVDQIRQIPLFADWSEDELSVFARSAERRRLRKGSFILVQTEPGDVGFVIMSGHVDVILEWPDGREFCLSRLGPGDHFGEMALIDPEPRSATVVTVTDAEVLVVRRQDFLRELLAHPPAMLRILASLSQRLRRTDAQVAGLVFDDTAARLGEFLSLNAVPHARGLVIEVSQAELATMVGATRQTVARVLSHWRRAGVIQTGRRRTIILQPDRLATLSRESA